MCGRFVVGMVVGVLSVCGRYGGRRGGRCEVGVVVGVWSV